MITYISMLRGVNVGGQKSIKMEELVALYESLGFNNVTTYVQSGNVIFNAPEGDSKVFSTMIEQKIKQVYDFPVAVMLRIMPELQRIVNNNPFLKEKGIDTDKLYVTFLSLAPAAFAMSQVQDMHDKLDKFVAINREIYLYCPDGYGRTKYSNNFFERKLGVTATTRNWKTVNTLLEIAKNQSR
jgi:uncharacterized protein (DUF1697 family)